jgi:hypothetical protein
VRLILIPTLAIFLNLTCLAQIDYWANLVYFSGCPINHIPKGITIPDNEKRAREIINAILAGAATDQLKKQFPDSLEVELSKLLQGNVIKTKHGRFEATFPVLIGENRKKLMDIVHQKVLSLDISMDSLIAPLALALKDHPQMIFHFLWSRIMDDCWWNLYKSEFNTDQGPPSIAFIVYPPHPMQCGTNSDYSSDNSQFAFSWSYDLFNEFFTIPPTSSFYNLAINKPIPENDRVFFLKHELLDSNNVSNIFSYHENDSLDNLCNELKVRYINRIKGVFDYQKLSKEFFIPADELFLVVAHEFAYEIFKALNDKKTSVYIPILKENNSKPDFSFLVSWRLSDSNKK